MPRLSAALGGPRLFVKRDDQTGLAGGGNKTRKLEYLLAEAQARGARTLITTGAVQSNHCRQTAAAAARFGYHCILILVGDYPPTITGNLLLDSLFGAEMIWTEPENREQTLKQTFDNAWEAGKCPYLIPYGGSNPTGASGYASAIQELRKQYNDFESELTPDWIVFASSSGGTQAGMLVGAKIFGFPGNILGISVDCKKSILEERVAKLASETATVLREPYNFVANDVYVNDHYLGEGYGKMGKAEQEAIHMFAQTEGLLLDPVYTGRAAAGLIDLIHQGYFNDHQTVLFWHTGGMPALFADRYQGHF
jgi:D-cysteine desulfhydrase family pyridoxal phosphate-dependent enzyme